MGTTNHLIRKFGEKCPGEDKANMVGFDKSDRQESAVPYVPEILLIPAN